MADASDVDGCDNFLDTSSYFHIKFWRSRDFPSLRVDDRFLPSEDNEYTSVTIKAKKETDANLGDEKYLYRQPILDKVNWETKPHPYRGKYSK